MKLVSDVNDHNKYDDGDLVLEEVENHQPSVWMRKMMNLKDWRCTLERRHVKNTDGSPLNCHPFCKLELWEESGRNTAPIEYTKATEEPPPHTRGHLYY